MVSKYPGIETDRKEVLDTAIDRMIDHAASDLTSGVEQTVAVEAPEPFDDATGPIPERPATRHCKLCGRESTGSVSTAGNPLSIICQPCRNKEDRALEARLIPWDSDRTKGVRVTMLVEIDRLMDADNGRGDIEMMQALMAVRDHAICALDQFTAARYAQAEEGYVYEDETVGSTLPKLRRLLSPRAARVLDELVDLVNRS